MALQPGAVQLMENIAVADIPTSGGERPGATQKVSISNISDTIPDASSTVKGIAEIAINAEAYLGQDATRIIAPAQLVNTITRLKFISFAGVAAPGPCTLTGALTTDILVDVVQLNAAGNAAASFEVTISVNDQIQQTNVGDLSTNLYLAILHPTL